MSVKSNKIPSMVVAHDTSSTILEMSEKSHNAEFQKDVQSAMYIVGLAAVTE